MVFAPLTSVNSHGQTILFASAILSDETKGARVSRAINDCYYLKIDVMPNDLV